MYFEYSTPCLPAGVPSPYPASQQPRPELIRTRQIGNTRLRNYNLTAGIPFVLRQYLKLFHGTNIAGALLPQRVRQNLTIADRGKGGPKKSDIS